MNKLVSQLPNLFIWCSPEKRSGKLLDALRNIGTRTLLLIVILTDARTPERLISFRFDADRHPLLILLANDNQIAVSRFTPEGV
jgi:hypothetical protein